MTKVQQVIETSDISLLYPDGKSSTNVSLSEYTCNQLDFDCLIDTKSCNIGDFFTQDPDVILYRQETFKDMLKFPELSVALGKMIPLLNDISDLRRMSSDMSYSVKSYLYSITEIELYISVLELLRETLSPLSSEFQSPAFQKLSSRIIELTESEYYQNLNSRLRELTSRVREIKSVTLGVNLDPQLRAKSAGLLSVNNEPFKSGELLDKILRLDFKSDEMTCIASLVPFEKGQSENQQLALSNALYSALNEVFKSSIKSWKKVIQEYVLENTDFLIRLMPEIEFVTKSVEFLRHLEEKNCTLCYPQIREKALKEFYATGLYNPIINTKLDTPVVQNDFTFDKDGMIFVLTGPNRGGKSVITCAVGIAFLMAQLGLPVCADSCTISPCDNIFTHFPTGSDDTIDKGRLGEECSRLEKILDNVTGYSLVLLDESLSSTGSFEGSFIASEVLSGLCVAGCRGIFSTHLHDLAASVDKINEKCAPLGGVKIDNLVAEVDPDGTRSFKILREAPDGKSYAKDIAKKYGLSFDEIINKINKNIKS